jgi:hypothetical protein
MQEILFCTKEIKMTTLIKFLLLTCAVLCLYLACQDVKQEPKEMTAIDDIFQSDIDTPGSVMPAALRIVPGNSWRRWISGDSILSNGFALMSQDSSNAKERIVTDVALLDWLIDLLPDSLDIQADTLTISAIGDTLTIQGSNSVSVPFRVYGVDDADDVLEQSFPLGTRIINRANGAQYIVQASEVTGYTTDSVAVIPTGGRYAVLQPDSRGFINVDWLGASGDGVTDDTDEFETMLQYCGVRKHNMTISQKTYAVQQYEARNTCLRLTSVHSGLVFEGNGGTIKSIDESGVNAIIRLEISTAVDPDPITNVTIRNLNIEGNIYNTAGIGGANGIHFYVPDPQENMTFIDDVVLDNIKIKKTSTGIAGFARSVNLSNIIIDSIVNHGIGLMKRGFDTQGAFGDVDSLSDVAGEYVYNYNNITIKNCVARDFGVDGGFAVDFSGSLVGTTYRDNSEHNITNLVITNFDRAMKVAGYCSVHIVNAYIRDITRGSSSVIWMSVPYKTFTLENAYIENTETDLFSLGQVAESIMIKNVTARNIRSVATNPVIRLSGAKFARIEDVNIINDSIRFSAQGNLLNIIPPLRSTYTLENIHLQNFDLSISRILADGSEGTVIARNVSWTNCYGSDANGSVYVTGEPTARLIMENCQFISDSTPTQANADDFFIVIDTIAEVQIDGMYVENSPNHITDLTNGATKITITRTKQLNPISQGGGVPDGEIMRIGDRYLWYSDSLSRWLTSTSWPTSHIGGSAVSPLPTKIQATASLSTTTSLDPKLLFEPSATTLTTGNSLGSIDWISVDNSVNSAGVVGRISLVANQAFSGVGNSNFIFTTSQGVAGTLSEAMRINYTREVQINNSTDLGAYNLQVTGDTYISGKIRLGAIDIVNGTGSPEGAVTAPAGSMYLNTTAGAGTTLYVKESGAGNTGWVAK